MSIKCARRIAVVLRQDEVPLRMKSWCFRVGASLARRAVIVSAQSTNQSALSIVQERSRDLAQATATRGANEEGSIGTGLFAALLNSAK
jgi:hypothetical protein